MCSRHAEYGAGYDITDAQSDYLQESFIEFHVLMDVNKWDPEEGRAWITTKATGPLDAMRRVRELYPAAAVLRAER